MTTTTEMMTLPMTKATGACVAPQSGASLRHKDAALSSPFHSQLLATTLTHRSYRACGPNETDANVGLHRAERRTACNCPPRVATSADYTLEGVSPQFDVLPREIRADRRARSPARSNVSAETSRSRSRAVGTVASRLVARFHRKEPCENSGPCGASVSS
jgi:hypothetical protein